MKISKVLLIPLFASAVIASPAQSILAADGYNVAFQTCHAAILEKFGDDRSLKVNRKSFRKQGKIYKVRYVVEQGNDATVPQQRHIVTCKTNRKGELRTLDVKSD